MQVGNVTSQETFRIVDSGAYRLVSVYGDVDGTNAAGFRLACSGGDDTRPVIVDLVKCSYIDSIGLGVLVSRSRKARLSVVLTPACRIYRIFEVTGLLGQFKIAASPAEAVAAN